MSRKNIANYTTFNSILVNNLQIQSSGIGLSIFDADPTNPAFSFNPTTGVCNMVGTLNVIGDASFETITVSEFEGGMQSLATNNPGNTWDLGINANYNDGTSKYTGIIKDASDSLQRWTFFKDITTVPGTTVETIDYTKFDSVRMHSLYVNDGSVTTPSITFHGDVGLDTGLYLAAQNEMGFTAGGVKVAGLRYISGTATELELDSTTTLKFKKLGTMDDVASLTMPSINTGHIYLKSANASDKWLKFYSYIDAATPSYSGAVFTSPTKNYFLLNTGANLELVQNTTIASDTSSPDYRDSTTSQILIVNGTASIETKGKILIPLGSLGSPTLAFAQETTTGFFHPSTDTIAVAINSANVLNISYNGITVTQAISNINGTVSTPAYAFTTNAATGMWRNNAAAHENISFSANGTSLGYFWLRTTPQWITGSSGSAAIPSIAWSNDIYTGLFSPTSEAASGQLAISLNTTEIARFRGRSGTGSGNIEFYNSLMITPNGSIQKISINSTDTRITNTFKTNDAWFQAYNLIDANPVFLYTFRSSGLVGKDYSNNGYNATLVGSPTTTALIKDTNGIIKRDVLDLTGNTTKYLDLTTNLSALTSLDNVSISFWFKISGTLSTDNTIFNCYKPTGTKEISIKVLSDGSSYPNALQVTVMSDSLTTYQYHTATLSDLGTPVPISIKDDLWHHVVIHLGSATGSPNPKHFMYVDGVELNVASNTLYVTSSGTDIGNPEASTNSFDDLTFSYASIGAFYNGGVGSLFYTGYLKDFYITGRIISVDEVSTLYSEPYVYTYGLDAAVINASQINALNSMYFANGTAAAPSITFTSDTNLGIYRSTTDVLGIATSGAERLTIADSILKFNAGASTDQFQIDGTTTNAWLKLKMSPGSSLGPRIVFQHTGTAAMHSIRSNHHSSQVINNYLDFYLYDISGVDGAGLGTNQVIRMGETAAGPNTALLTIYGISRSHDGAVGTPAYSFTNSTGLGLYRIANNDLGIAANGTLRFEVNTVVTVGNASGDATTRLYVPLGTQALPAYSFIGDTNTGIFSSTADNIDISCGNTLVSNFSTAGLLNQLPIIVDVTSAAAFVIRQNGAVAGGDILSVDTTNSRVGFGYDSLYMARSDTYNSTTTQRMKFGASAALSGVLGLLVLNENATGASTAISSLTLGRTESTRNSADISFNYVSTGSTSNKIQFGFNGVSADQFNIMADGSTNVTGTFGVSSTSTFSGQLVSQSGTTAAPTYSFIGDADTGMYRVAANKIGFSASNGLKFEIGTADSTFYVQLRSFNGSASAPGLAFTGDSSSGFFYNSGSRFSVSNGNQATWVFDKRGTAPHECLNEIYFKPDGTNIRTYMTNKKLMTSSNQTILQQSPAIHLKFLSDPNSNTTTQDKSIFGSTTSINGTITYTTSSISLTDTNGVGLLNTSAITLADDTTGYLQTSSDITDLLKIDTFDIHLKVKLINIHAISSLLYISGNSVNTNNYLLFMVDTGITWRLYINVGGSNIVTITGNTTLNIDTWYDIKISFTNSGITVYTNGTADTSTSAVSFDFRSFTDTSAMIFRLGSNPITAQNANSYIHEVCIQPTLTTETSSATYRTQAHEIYTNKLQLANIGGLVDEGYLLRSDKGNNMLWDNSMQIYPGYIQFNSSKVLRAPDGTASLPAYSFINSTNSGMFRTGTSNNIGLVTGGTKRIDIADAATGIINDLQLSSGFKRSAATIATTTATLDSTHNIVLCSYAADASNVTITLPAASSHVGREYLLIKTGAGGGSLIINTASGSDFIDDAVTTQITLSGQYDRVTLICGQSNRWFTV
jgi:hypothetical protein